MVKTFPTGFNEYCGANVEQMPALLKHKEISPMSVAGLMKSRIIYGDQFPVLLDNYFDTSDLIAYSDSDVRKVKFIFTTDNQGKITRSGRVALNLIKPNKERFKGVVVLGNKYDSIQGIEVPVEELGILDRDLTRAQILNSKVWRMLARNPDEVPKDIAEDAQLLPEYVDFIASRREAREWSSSPIMGVYMDGFDKAKLRAWYVRRLEGRSNAGGRNLLDYLNGRLVGLAPEALVKLNGWKPSQKEGERTREIITIESLLDETGYTSDYAPTQIKKLQNILDERGCVIVKK